MAETEAQRAARVKSLTDAIDAAYKSTRVAATKISGLLQVGKATCDEVRTYNLFALGIYDMQKSMLATLRAIGQTGLPDLPTQPTLFAWKGMSGFDALNFPCGSKASTLSGLLGQVLQGPGPDAQFISSNDVEISTQGINLYNPDAAPKLQAFVQSLEAEQAMRQAQQGQAGLGIAPLVLIALAGVGYLLGTTMIEALAKFFTTRKVEEEDTKRYQQYAATYTAFLATRLKCIEDCVAKGNSQAGCTATCERALPVPKNPAEVIRDRKPQWSTLELVGLSAAVLVGGVVVYKLWQRKERTGSLLPSFSLPGE
jgi:hypothetical protein